MKETTSSIKTKLFVGVELAPRLLYILNQKSSWKSAEIEFQSATKGPQLVIHGGKTYFGKSHSQTLIPFTQVQEELHLLRSLILQHGIDPSEEKNLNEVVFSEVYVS